MRLLILETNHAGAVVSDPRKITERPDAQIMGMIWDWFDADPELSMLKAVHENGCHFEVMRA